ncbi:hypothetical protein PANDA_006640, partial [Ailuropoda melanoleuca]
FNIPFTSMDRSSEQVIKKETVALNDTLDHVDLTDMFGTFHPKTAENTFFSSTHGTFSKRDHILGYKASLKKFKKIYLIPCIFSDHNAMKLEISHKKKSGKNTNTWRLHNVLLNN